MTSQENIITVHQNTAPQQDKKWSELLQSLEHDIESLAVQDQVEVTSGAVVYGLLPWNILNPAGEVARLMKLREPANDNNSQNVIHGNSQALKKAA